MAKHSGRWMQFHGVHISLASQFEVGHDDCCKFKNYFCVTAHKHFLTRDLRIGRLRSNRIRIESGVTIPIRIKSRIELAVYDISWVNDDVHRHRIDKYLDTLLANQPISDGEATDRCQKVAPQDGGLPELIVSPILRDQSQRSSFAVIGYTEAGRGRKSPMTSLTCRLL